MKSAIGTILSTLGLCGLKIMSSGSRAIYEVELNEVLWINAWAYDYRENEEGELLWRHKNLEAESESIKRDIIGILNKHGVELLEYEMHETGNRFVFNDINSEIWDGDEEAIEVGSNQLDFNLEICVSPHGDWSKEEVLNDIKLLIVNYFTRISGENMVNWGDDGGYFSTISIPPPNRKNRSSIQRLRKI